MERLPGSPEAVSSPSMAIRQYVDALPLKALQHARIFQSVGEVDRIDYQLAHGSPDRSEDLHDALLAELDTEGRTYISQIAMLAEDAVPCVGESSKRNMSTSSAERMDQILAYAQRWEPGEEALIMADAVKAVEEHFVIADLPSDTVETSEASTENEKEVADYHARMACRGMDDIAQKLQRFCPDAMVVRRFLQSDFARYFRSPRAQFILLSHLNALEQNADPEALRTDPAFQEAAQGMADSLANDPSRISPLLRLVKQTPTALHELLEREPQLNVFHELATGAQSVLLSLDPIERTHAHTELLQVLETRAAMNADAYAHFLQNGLYAGCEPTSDQINQLRGLMARSPGSALTEGTAYLVCAFTPVEQLAATLEADERLLVDNTAAAIAIQRLARAGSVQEAENLIGWSYSSADINTWTSDMLRNSLLMYKETGDPRYLDRASEHGEVLQQAWRTDRSAGEIQRAHEIDFSYLDAARTQGRQDIAEGAWKEIQSRHEKYMDSLPQLGRLAVHYFLGNADPLQAEQMFDEIHSRDYVYWENADLMMDLTWDALRVVKAYRDAGMSEDAARMVQRYFVKGRLSKQVLSAIAVGCGNRDTVAPYQGLHFATHPDPLTHYRQYSRQLAPEL